MSHSLSSISEGFEQPISTVSEQAWLCCCTEYIPGRGQATGSAFTSTSIRFCDNEELIFRAEQALAEELVRAPTKFTNISL